MKITDWCNCYLLNFKTCRFWKPILVLSSFVVIYYQDMTSLLDWQQTCSLSCCCCCRALFKFSICSFIWPSSSTSWLLSLTLCSFCSCRKINLTSIKVQSLFNYFLCCSLWSLLLRHCDKLDKQTFKLAEPFCSSCRTLFKVSFSSIIRSSSICSSAFSCMLRSTCSWGYPNTGSQ